MMESEPTKALATRLPATEVERIEAAIEETGLTKSALVREAVQFYIAENPHHLTAFAPADFTGQMIAEFENR